MGVNIEGEFQAPVNIGESHLPCVILVDTSGSMAGSSIQELNSGLETFIDTLRNDGQAMGRVEVCVIEFSDDVTVSVPFTPADDFAAPYCEASGMTAMNQAILTALDLLEERKEVYRQYNVKYYRPWLFLMTDGGATDSERKAEVVQRLNDYRARKKINFFPLGIGSNADWVGLKEYAGGGAVLKADANNFKEAFVWLSHSLSVISDSNPGEKVQAPPLPNELTLLA